MKVAIHVSGKSDFSKRWLAYCKENNINHKVVDCYSNTIVNDLEGYNVLLWHHDHANPKDAIIAKQILYALATAGIVVFPNFYTGWHFDDKLGQKYLFEALKIPAVNSYSFFTKAKALAWVASTTFPKVFKLRTGAGSRNVRLVKNKKEAKSIINKAFSKGFRQYDAIGGIKENIRKYRLKKTSFKEVLKAFAHLIYPIQLEKSLGRERGYVYFQDFIPNNTYDIRVIVIGNKAFALKRNIRKDDFRASGSGFIEYEKELFSNEIIGLSFTIASKIKSDCLAVDYVFLDNKPLVVEVSYGFSINAYDKCEGYWTDDLKWHNQNQNACGWMIEDAIAKTNKFEIK